ncbi:MAG: hypothetical protein H0U74_12560 [Bradymonadaceae bacterium]|nr:hypothetical protein [Lujinxingiaceae bacterium]
MSSNRIAGTHAPSSMPWSESASAEVQGLRRAITAHLNNAPVDTDVAPMMSELLARLESFVKPAKESDLRAPASPDPSNPPGATEAMAALGRACDSARKTLEARPAGEGHQRIGAMLAIVERHIEMKHEIVLRSEQPGSIKG